MNKYFALSLLLLSSTSLSSLADSTRPSFQEGPNGKYGYMSSHGKTWLTEPIYDYYRDSRFDDNDYAIVKMADKVRLINSMFQYITPTWTKEAEVVDNMVITNDDVEGGVIYNLQGEPLLKANSIKPIWVWTKESEKKTKKTLLALSIEVSPGKYGLYDVEFQAINNELSVYHIHYAGGLFLIRTSPYTGIIVNAQGEIIDSVSGREISLRTAHHTGSMKVGDKKYQENNMLSKSYYMDPVYIFEGTQSYDGKGRGLIFGVDIFKPSRYKYSMDLCDKKENQIVKFFLSPEIVEMYNARIIKPYQALLEKNKEWLTNNYVPATTLQLDIIPVENGYCLSADGVVPLESNKTTYTSLLRIGNTGCFEAMSGERCYILNRNGQIIDDSKFHTAYTSIGNNNDYILCRLSTGGYNLMTKEGNYINYSRYDIIYSEDSPLGEIFRFSRDNRWGIWVPKAKHCVYADFEYVGSPDESGKVPVRLLGVPGWYNVLTGEKCSPVKTAFYQAYNESDFTKAISLYEKTLELDTELRKGFTGPSLNNIGVLYEESGNISRAIEYYEKAIKEGNNNASDNLSRIKRNDNLNTVSSTLNTFAKSLQEFANDSQISYEIRNTTDLGTQTGLLNNRNATMYKNLYNKWENNAKRIYETLTRNGAQISENGKATGGISGTAGPNYVRQKQLLRDAQREMRKTREQAAKEGIQIPQSTYENVTVRL